MDEELEKHLTKHFEKMKDSKPDLELLDKEGCVMTFNEYEGCYYPAFPAICERLQTIRDFPLQEDDVYICSYPKSGAHWHYELCKMITEQTAVPVKGTKSEVFIDMMPDEVINLFPSPRFINSHFKPEYIPKCLLAGRIKIIYIIRNPKDAYVSFYHHKKVKGRVGDEYKGSWSAFLQMTLEDKIGYGSWFDYTLAWERFLKDHPDLPVLTLHYEDTKQNPAEQSHRIAKFLGSSCDEGLIRQIADATEINKLRQKKMDDAENDPASLTIRRNAIGLYRKGEVGDWKNWFTVAESERFDEIYKQKMRQSAVNVRFEL